MSILEMDKENPRIKKILEQDLSEVRERYMSRYKKNEKQAKLAEAEYKKFAALGLLEPDLLLAPSGFVDEFWHEYILDTEEYRAFCQENLSFFWEHDPKITADEAMPLYKNTIKAYRKHFGEPNKNAWGLKATHCSYGYPASRS